MGCSSLERNLETRKKIWESNCGPIFMGAGGFNQKHGVGILLNERWKRKIIKTENVRERMITDTIKYQHRRIELASVYFCHSGSTDVHIEKMYSCIEDPDHRG